MARGYREVRWPSRPRSPRSPRQHDASQPAGCEAQQSRIAALFRTLEYPKLPILLERVATKTGKGGFYKLASHGMNGAFHLDSAWHHGWETVAALVATTKATTR